MFSIFAVATAFVSEHNRLSVARPFERRASRRVMCRDVASGSCAPLPGFAALVGNGVDLWAADAIFFVYERVGEAIEVVDAKATIRAWSTSLVLHDEVANPFVLGNKCLGDGSVGVYQM